MAIKYKEAVPWGRSYDEYYSMFNLTDSDLKLKIIGCADGPANFNSVMFKNGHRVVSCDPLYEFTAEQIKHRIDETYDTVIEQTYKNRDKFIWETIKSVDELGKIRLSAMTDFLADYEDGKKDGRYITAQLPELPFVSMSFDIALCSHFLFLYSDHFSYEFHCKSIEEMCRIANDVRIFPLLTYNSDLSPYVNPIAGYMKGKGFTVSLEKVPYEFQREGNMMMRIEKLL